MRLVASIAGVDYVDDSRSTHLDATLRAMADIDKPILWIAGGIAGEIGQARIQEFLRERIVALVLFGRTGSVGIEALKPFTDHMYSVEELRTAVFVAHELARQGEVVLFSPARPAEAPYADHEERGSAFQEAVHDLEAGDGTAPSSDRP